MIWRQRALHKYYDEIDEICGIGGMGTHRSQVNQGDGRLTTSRHDLVRSAIFVGRPGTVRYDDDRTLSVVVDHASDDSVDVQRFTETPGNPGHG